MFLFPRSYAGLTACVVFGSLVVTLASARDEGSCTVSVDGTSDCGDASSEQCTVYLAQSTVPNAGLGIFTTVGREVGDFVGDGDVVLPVVDLWYHISAHGESFAAHFLDPTADYVWFGPELGIFESAHCYSTTEHMVAFASGLDAAINCNLALNNVDKTLPEYDLNQLHRSTDPGTGAFTPYHKVRTYVTHPIPPGGELFKYYGDDWFLNRDFGLLPLSDNYPQAEELSHHFHEKINRRENLPLEAKEDLWNLISHDFPYASRTLNALPRHLSGVDTVEKEGIRAVYQPAAMRNVNEVEATGRCLENIVSGPSSIPQAGRGAFATRLLHKGTTITGSPLIFVPNRIFFEQYNGNWVHKDERPDKDQVVGYQILLNYCFHHSESSVFLCPYGAGINYINHSKEKANVHLQWADDGEMGHREEFLRTSPDAMLFSAAPGLFIDYIATRDIEAGEELFLDYGSLWEDKWNEHVEQWTPDEDASQYISARDYNVEYEDALLRTAEEQAGWPYPSHFQMRCLDAIRWQKELGHEEAKELWNPSVPGIPCEIEERKLENRQFLYKVYYHVPEGDLLEEGNHDETEVVWDLSDWIVRGAIRFVDVPYTTDLALPGAFRHPIGFPDDIFPEAWRGEHVSYR